jgi:hypothetical protein
MPSRWLKENGSNGEEWTYAARTTSADRNDRRQSGRIAPVKEKIIGKNFDIRSSAFDIPVWAVGSVAPGAL